jgi:hypothetical protein
VVGWRKILLERFGLELDTRQFDRLKKLFVRKSGVPGRLAKEAGAFEILRELKEGWRCNTTEGFRRYPSEFQASEWLEEVLALGHKVLDERHCRLSPNRWGPRSSTLLTTPFLRPSRPSRRSSRP